MSNTKVNQDDDAVVIALGSNLAGHYETSQALLEDALAQFPAKGLRLARVSRWWRSAAWPDPGLPDYLNGVALVDTDLAPRAVMAALLAIEQAFDRRRSARNAARTLDLDLVAYGRLVLSEEGLCLPHPRAHQRRFVMGPLAEIAPGWRHPVLGLTARVLAARADAGRDAAPAP